MRGAYSQSHSQIMGLLDRIRNVNLLENNAVEITHGVSRPPVAQFLKLYHRSQRHPDMSML